MKHTRTIGALLGITVGALLVGYWAGRARASGIPATSPMTYTGTLADADGKAVSGVHNFDLRIFGSASQSDVKVLCSFGPKPISVMAGWFQITIPDECTSVVHSLQDLWVEVFIDGSTLGRSRLGAVPFAVESDHATNATNAVTASSAALAASAAPGSALDQRIANAETSVSGKLAGIWFVAPENCVEIAHGTGWTDVTGMGVTVPLTKPAKVWATYSINLQPNGAPAAEILSTHLTVDGTVAEMSGSHYQPYTSGDSNANLVGHYVGELAAGNHTFQLQWAASAGSQSWSSCSTTAWNGGYTGNIGAHTVIVQAFYK